MKKSYIKPELEIVEYTPETEIMGLSSRTLDNNITWKNSWSLKDVE